MENIKQNLDNNVNPWVNNILRQDLKTLIDQKGKPLEQISQFSNVPTSILKDVLDGSSLLSDATIYRFYEYFLSIVDESETSVRHEWIKAKYLNEKRKNDGYLNQRIEDLICSSSLLKRLYLLTRLHELSIEQIYLTFGEDGLSAIELLREFEVVQYSDDDKIYLAGEKPISKNPRLLKSIMGDLVSNGVREKCLWKLQENSSFYGMENVNEETYIKILQILDETKDKVRRCIQDEDSKGDIPMFIVGVVDKYEFAIKGEEQ